MMRYLLCAIAAPLLCHNLKAQDLYNNHWYFGCGHNVHFTAGSPQNGGIPPPSTVPRPYHIWSNSPGHPVAVSHHITGALQFFVNIPLKQRGTGTTHTPVFMDRYGIPMPGGTVPLSSYDMANGYPLAVPSAADSLQYYIFTCLDKGLQYSIVDMRLNNGRGDILPGHLLLPLMPNGTVIGSKITIVPGCDGLYLIARVASFHGFVSLKITHNGVDTRPVYSYTGNFSLPDYQQNGLYFGTMKASPDGRMLAVGTARGLELYDIEPCSGLIKNARVIDTLMTFGACFSPDSRLLYTTRPDPQSGYYEASSIMQWDVSTPSDLNSIRTSGIQVLANSAYYWPAWQAAISSYMGDIAQGPDGKLYILSNTLYDENQRPLPLPPATTVPFAQTFHIIHQPDNRGMACQPERDAFNLNGRYIDRARYYLPHPIYAIPRPQPDTIYRHKGHITSCFGSGTSLATDSNATCITWYNGDTTTALYTKDTGKLWVRYAKECQWYTDTFTVIHTILPEIPAYLVACPGQAALTVTPRETHRYSYILQQQDGPTRRTADTDSALTFHGLPSGSYTLQVRSGSCDTTVTITIQDLPVPDVRIAPYDITLPYGSSVTLQASGAELYTWWPARYLDTAMGASVTATPQESVQYMLTGINAYGCRDTAYANITVDHHMQLWLPNAFTPNGDGLNDIFRIENVTWQQLLSWSIYNRYGTEVFSAGSIHDGWDGNHKNRPCDAGVYYYMLQYYNTDRTIQTLKGEVHLLR